MNGIAAKVDYLTLSVASLKNTILRVAEDKYLANNMQERSKLYRDQPMKPLEKAIWWVEFVIRNPNATHLRSPALNMNFFVAHSLDVLVVLLIVPILFLFISCKIMRFCLCNQSKLCKIPNNYRNNAENRKKNE